MFPTNEMFIAAEVAYRQERVRTEFGPRRKRRIRLSLFPKVAPVTQLSRRAGDWVRAA